MKSPSPSASTYTGDVSTRGTPVGSNCGIPTGNRFAPNAATTRLVSPSTGTTTVSDSFTTPPGSSAASDTTWSQLANTTTCVTSITSIASITTDNDTDPSSSVTSPPRPATPFTDTRANAPVLACVRPPTNDPTRSSTTNASGASVDDSNQVRGNPVSCPPWSSLHPTATIGWPALTIDCQLSNRRFPPTNGDACPLSTSIPSKSHDHNAASGGSPIRVGSSRPGAAATRSHATRSR